MRYVVIDLEATCWENDGPFQRENSEVIEVGAIASTEGLNQVKEIQLYIQPAKYPILTDYCTNLTGITQNTINKAWPARVVYKDFLDWLTPNYLGCTMVAWGNYDWRMLKKEMDLYDVRFPFNSSINLKQCFADFEGSRPKGLRRAIESLGWTFQGKHHSGLDDARNTDRILKYLLKEAKHVIKPTRV
jgi:inhibitor of KinA sporulation pathway (predicted exonuclease)